MKINIKERECRGCLLRIKRSDFCKGRVVCKTCAKNKVRVKDDREVELIKETMNKVALLPSRITYAKPYYNTGVKIKYSRINKILKMPEEQAIIYMKKVKLNKSDWEIWEVWKNEIRELCIA